MQNNTKAKIKKLVLDMVDAKLKRYEQETKHTPFFEAIFSLQNIYTASIIHSFYTSFGMSVYEQLAILLAQEQGWHVQRQYNLLGSINDDVVLLINRICNVKSLGKADEIEQIRKAIIKGQADKHLESVVDIYIKKPDGTELYFDITTVKANLKEFRAMRKKMLNWVALRLSQDNLAKVQTYIGLPYNPYYPKPYKRWTGLENDPSEILVQADLWNTLAGYEVYDEFMGVFNEAGLELKEKVEEFISKNRNR